MTPFEASPLQPYSDCIRSQIMLLEREPFGSFYNPKDEAQQQKQSPLVSLPSEVLLLILKNETLDWPSRRSVTSCCKKLHSFRTKLETKYQQEKTLEGIFKSLSGIMQTLFT
jgi:hypothetical protein